MWLSISVCVVCTFMWLYMHLSLCVVCIYKWVCMHICVYMVCTYMYTYLCVWSVHACDCACRHRRAHPPYSFEQDLSLSLKLGWLQDLPASVPLHWGYRDTLPHAKHKQCHTIHLNRPSNLPVRQYVTNPHYKLENKKVIMVSPQTECRAALNFALTDQFAHFP